jgi:hypothetical protein
MIPSYKKKKKDFASDEIIMTVDLSSIPILEAPPIDDFDTNKTLIKDLSRTSPSDSKKKQFSKVNFFFGDMEESQEEEISVAGTISRFEAEFFFNSNSQEYLSSSTLQVKTEEITIESEPIPVSIAKRQNKEEDLNVLMSRMSNFMEEAARLRNTIRDLSDSEARKMRSVHLLFYFGVLIIIFLFTSCC